MAMFGPFQCMYSETTTFVFVLKEAHIWKRHRNHCLIICFGNVWPCNGCKLQYTNFSLKIAPWKCIDDFGVKSKFFDKIHWMYPNTLLQHQIDHDKRNPIKIWPNAKILADYELWNFNTKQTLLQPTNQYRK